MILNPLSKERDNRRILVHLFQDDIKDVNYWEAKKGSILGNHHHKETKEYFFITKGSALVTTDTYSGVVSRGALFAVEPNTTHSVECLSDLNFLTFLTKAYDNERPDIYK